MNRFRKTGTYIKPDNAGSTGEDNGGLTSDMSRMFGGIVAPTSALDEYGHEYGDEEYEGGEKEVGFIDIDAEQAMMERIKEE